MYFTSHLNINPSQITQIHIIKPKKIFARILHILTSGKTSQKQEKETFTAISILQQFSLIFKSIGIQNIVRLAKDDFDFYFDQEGKKNDLEKSLDSFQIQVDSFESEIFNTLYLILEHEDSELKYLIEVKINRCHPIGKYPITIKINGIIKYFKKNLSETKLNVKDKISSIFSNQETYDSFLKNKENLFQFFISTIKQSIQKYIPLDHMIEQSQKNIIRPKKSMDSIPTQKNYSSEPIYHGYHGFSDFLPYTLLWASMLYSHHIYMNNFNMVDHFGHTLMKIGEQDFDNNHFEALNPDFYDKPIAQNDYSSQQEVDHNPETSIWLDSLNIDNELTNESFEDNGIDFNE